MRIAFVSMLTAAHRETPATRRTRRVARQLAARGHDVVVLCSGWWDGPNEEFQAENVLYRAIVDEPSARTFATRLPFALRKVKPDVVHAVNSPPGHVRAANAAGTVVRAPVVVDWWNDVEGDSAKGYRRAARAADAVLTPSETVKTRVREHGAREADVRVVPESVDMDLVRSASVDNRADVVYARDLDAACNVEGFLLALAELRNRDWRATVVGDGPLREEAEGVARDLRIDDRVEFLGDLSREERVPIFKGAHLFAQTAFREAFPADLLWALACGCLGVVEYQADSSAHELVEGRDRGRLVTSPQELAAEIAAAGSVPHETVNEDYAAFDHDAVLERYLDCYRATVDAHGLF
ncbi:glycosyltransferase family 4 protein [Halobium salinum]|uniref:Glycosyltransferase family 4 protein n=1 Tax=Halobium salinum TaxID=1364940 RepID=A0ABD5PCS0_9EURY|nr:glycosyltransferase family 4 protein [Halobium salinum]